MHKLVFWQCIYAVTYTKALVSRIGRMQHLLSDIIPSSLIFGVKHTKPVPASDPGRRTSASGVLLFFGALNLDVSLVTCQREKNSREDNKHAGLGLYSLPW